MTIVERPTLLLFEPDIDGHPREWLDHIVRYAATRSGEHTVKLLLSPPLAIEMRGLYAGLLSDQLQILEMSASEHQICQHHSLLVRAFARWRMARRYARRTDAQQVHFQAIDHLALPLAFGLGLHGCSISGILFRPSTHYVEFDHRRRRAGEWLRDLRKSFLYHRMLAHPHVRHIYSLDPYFPDYAARRDANGTKVVAIPDPMAVPAMRSDRGRTRAWRARGGRVEFLLFGHLTERKGILVLLRALAVLHPEAAERVTVVLAGGVDEPLQERVTQELDLLARTQPDLVVKLEDRRLSQDELRALVERADIVLAPYQRFVGSSGVLLWAAAAGKPVIAQDYGLVGRLVRDHGLGVIVDTTDHGILARALEWAAFSGGEGLIDRDGAANFVAQRTPDLFAATVLADTVGHSEIPEPYRAEMPAASA